MSLDEEKSPYRPFQAHPVEPHYGRDRGFLVHHLKLDVKIDERAGTIEGTTTHDMEAVVDLDAVELDAEDLEIREARIDGEKVEFEAERKKLTLRPRRKIPAGRKLQVRVRYAARPKRGLYFVRPDKHYPRKPYQVWSQGESEDNRAWFPAYDYPNNKSTFETLLTVRKGLTGIGNGRLVATKPMGKGWIQYHWRLDQPMPTYLLAIVVGDFDTLKVEWDGIPLTYYVPQGKRAEGHETFKHTPQILEFFSKATGYRYPYPKYAQAVIADFMWGGMENTSLTTVNDRFLIRPEHREDANPDGLIAHEAAHQWFGDLVTAKSWEHIWLNEAFATYFDALFHEHFYGIDWFHEELRDNAEAYFSEDKEQYRRPIVTRHFSENEDVFDRHTYQKGSLVLHMLRKELGDDLWWKSVRHYLKKHEWRNVETTDLKVAIEEATGRNLDWFFDQWVYKAGHPDLEATTAHDPKTRQVKVTLKQTQKVVGETPVFRFPLTLWLWTAADKHTEHTIHVSKAEESYFLPSREKPKLVQFDPEGIVLKTLKVEGRDAQEWAFQVQHAPLAAGRIEATKALGKKPNDPHATPALRRALEKDKFWAVRMAAADALGDQETAEALEALPAGMRDAHPRVRRAVADALGNFTNEAKAMRLLERIIAKDKSDYVVAVALRALAKLRSPKAYGVLKAHLGKRSHNEVVAGAALLGLAELKDPRALPLLLERTRYGFAQPVRSAATYALARLWEFVDKRAQEEIRRALERLFKDPMHQERRALFNAVATLPDPTIRARLGDAKDAEPIGLVRVAAREGFRRNAEKAGFQSQLGDLKRQFEELQQENKKLKGKLAEIEKRLVKAR